LRGLGTATAEDDFRSILLGTATRFGDAQARVSAETLSSAVEALAERPRVVGTSHRVDGHAVRRRSRVVRRAWLKKSVAACRRSWRR
jgi:plasmid stabilization system protein ParE